MTLFYGEDRQINILVDEEENRVSRANIDKWIFRLLLILIGFMPIIVLAHVREVISPQVSNISLLFSGTKGDIFTYYKFLLILIITIVSAILLLIKLFFMNGTIRKTVLNYILGLFAISIVISTIFSPNISIALAGQYNRSDGAISWLCYIALMFIAMNINYPKNAVNKIIYSLYPFVFINFIIITMNFTGNDLMQKEWVKKLVTVFLPEGANLAEGAQLVGTLNQWNYMSGMFAIMTVIFLAAALVGENWLYSIINTVVAVLSIAIMFMSISTSGFVTVLILFLPIVIILFRLDNKLKGIIILTIFLVLSGGTLHFLSKENPKVWAESFGFLIDKNPYEEESASQSTTNFELINRVYASDRTFELPELPERAVAAGTGRVYIWEKTFDLLKDRLLLGYGLDSLMYNFPHYNIDARAGLFDENQIVDKPHNIFVGILYGTGLVGFISLILVFATTMIYLIKAFIKKVDIQYFILGIASLGYFVQGMFNDSLPGISGVAWITIGIFVGQILNENKKDIKTEKI
ncbi:O-antigen ligase family protein [Ureibacillus thermosphaericus]|uniref:O-antigen ligase-related domain-containing protein n=1 Tax=Ureibacillus thermosphaericus TaxID=51173 RepID=A0A840PPZ1_URETH|nr:O-antigen ligase family protein [Ureibacillus thermosphaericus]MBB5150475.1 hypothetical protein [Ureibacillus thermosphaericus]NKZ33094.1 O-antigen ligase family protein [Ureibacillus thermosphaericus]